MDNNNSKIREKVESKIRVEKSGAASIPKPVFYSDPKVVDIIAKAKVLLRQMK
ncbi:MAG: hypothetical protein AAGC88_07845 [Bacteroidota bacterium]